MRIDRKSFFSQFRELFGRLNQEQVVGIDFLLSKIEKDSWSLPQSAYVLATVSHETANTFQPIKEFRSRPGSKGRANQDRYWLSGYYGRGYLQITWRKNYEKFGLADDPDSALEPEVAYDVLSRGMKFGMFTGHKITEFINDSETDYVNARKVINGLDRAQDIARAAGKFEAILGPATAERPDKPLVNLEVENKPNGDDGIQMASPASGAVNEPAAKEVKMSQMSNQSKTLTWTMIGSAILLALKEAWTSAKAETISAGKYAVEHLPQTLLILGLAALGIWIYNQAMKRKDQRTNKIIDIAADKTKNDVVIT